MKNILLVCSAGMSTSLLVTKMQKAAVEANIDINIWATGSGNYKNEIDKADAILLGPQVRFMLNEVKIHSKGKPVEVIDMISYGKIDGKAVLNHALKLV